MAEGGGVMGKLLLRHAGSGAADARFLLLPEGKRIGVVTMQAQVRIRGIA